MVDDPLPWPIPPMKAVPGELPADEAGWAFEIKWDGMRALASVDGGPLRLQSANLLVITGRFPELAPLGVALAEHRLVLDGELVAPGPDGRPDFGALQRRMHVAHPREAQRRATLEPVTFMIFDVLHLDGHDVTPLGYRERRTLLADVVVPGPGWQLPAHHDGGDGAALLAAATDQGLEGLLAKRVDSRYEPGRRSRAWRKVKVRRRQEVVVGGWQPGEAGRAGTLGSLLVGYFEGTALRYAGRVGTGFSGRELRHLQGLLDGLAVPSSPFDPVPPHEVSRRARWAAPELVAEVAFGEWTSAGILRHPAYLGLRADKAAADVVREG